MSETSTFDLPQAARRLGVSVRDLRGAVRAGRVAAPPHLSATAALPAEWVATVQAAAATSPGLFAATARQKVPAYARYEGTSAWRKYRNRVRAYNRFRATHPA